MQTVGSNKQMKPRPDKKKRDRRASAKNRPPVMVTK